MLADMVPFRPNIGDDISKDPKAQGKRKSFGKQTDARSVSALSKLLVDLITSLCMVLKIDTFSNHSLQRDVFHLQSEVYHIQGWFNS